MADSEITRIRKALAATFGSSIHKYDYVPDVPVTPAAFVFPGDFKYHPTVTGGESDYTFIVRLYTAAVNTQAGQEQLDALISPDGTSSLVAAIEADQTLGGIVTSAIVTDHRRNGVVAVGNGRYYSAELVVSVFI